MSSQDPLKRQLSNPQFVLRVAEGLTADPATQDDVVQETLIAASLLRPSDIKSPHAWLGATARNIYRKHTRSRIRRAARERVAARAERVVPSERTYVDARDEILAALAALSPTHLEVLILHFYECLSPTEIARTLDTPRGTIRTRLEAALATIRGRLRRAWTVPGARTVQLPTTSEQAAEEMQRVEDKLFLCYGKRPCLEYIESQVPDCDIAAHRNLSNVFRRIREVLYRSPGELRTFLREEPTPFGRSLGFFLWHRHAPWTRELCAELLDDVGRYFAVDGAEICYLKLNLLRRTRYQRPVLETVAQVEDLIVRLRALRSVKARYVESSVHTLLVAELLLLSLLEPAHRHLKIAGNLNSTFGFDYLDCLNKQKSGAYFTVFGCHRSALAAYQHSASRSLLEEVGAFALLCSSHSLATQAALELGDMDTARDELDALEAVVQSDTLAELNPFVLAQHQVQLGNYCWRLGDEEACRRHHSAAFRLFDHVGHGVGTAVVRTYAVEYAFEAREFSRLCDALSTVLIQMRKSRQPVMPLRQFLLRYVWSECDSEPGAESRSPLAKQDLIALSHNPDLMTQVMVACFLDAHRKAGRNVTEPGRDLLRDVANVIESSSIPEIHERWISTGDSAARGRLEAAVVASARSLAGPSPSAE